MKQKIRWPVLIGGIIGQVAYVLLGGRIETALCVGLGFVAYALLARYMP